MWFNYAFAHTSFVICFLKPNFDRQFLERTLPFQSMQFLIRLYLLHVCTIYLCLDFYGTTTMKKNAIN